jgi:hypothetical protein
MPYKKVAPVSEEVMENTRYEGHHSICQTLRDIYKLTDNEDIKLKCRIATAMAKSMHLKLKYYREKELKHG